MAIMDLTSGDNAMGCDKPRSPAGTGVVFTPLAYDGFTWLNIDEPQRDARSACMVVAAFVHLLMPGASLSELEARAEAAVRVLERGAAWTTVIDDNHRVERAVRVRASR
jgi:hypothetical protein